MFKTGGQSVIQAGVWMFRTPVVSITFPKNLALINVGGWVGFVCFQLLSQPAGF